MDRIERFRAALVLSAFAAPGASAGIEHYEGIAHALDGGGAVVYRESHWRYVADAQAREVVLYRCPDGTPFARKRVSRPAGAEVPDFDLVDARGGYREGVRRAGDGRRVVYFDADGKPPRSATIALREDAVIDSGFDAFVRANWTRLVDGDAAPLAFLVPSRLGYVGFEARRIDGGSAHDLRRFRLSLDAWYGFALPHVDVAYDATTRALAEYRGISDIRSAGGGNLRVRIEFPVERHGDDTTSADVEDALSLRLHDTCPSP